MEDGDEGQYLIPVPNGNVVKVTFTSGDYDEEVTYQLYDGNGTLLLDEGFEPEIGEVLSITNNCPD